MTDIANDDPGAASRETIREAHNPKLVRTVPSDPDVPRPPHKDLADAKPDYYMDAPPLGDPFWK